MVLSQSNVSVEPGMLSASCSLIVIAVLFAYPCSFKVTVDPLVPKTPVLAERVWVELKVFVIC